MKKPVPAVYNSTFQYMNKMEMINSLHSYIRRSNKAFILEDKGTLKICYDAISLIIAKLSKENLNIFQEDLIKKYTKKAKKYLEYYQAV